MNAMTDAERQRRRRARLAEERGATITVALSPEAARKLGGWVAKGESATAVINRLLRRSKP